MKNKLSKQNMTLYNYQTGEKIRELTEDEVKAYMWLSRNGTSNSGTGAVDGLDFGLPGIAVYAE